MNRQCPGITRSGDRCTQRVQGDEYHCYWHNPANSDKRRRVAAKGGRSKKSQLSKDLHALLEDLTERVISGELEPYPASVAGQLTGVRLRVLEHERKERESQELESRIEELEAALEQQRGRAYG